MRRYVIFLMGIAICMGLATPAVASATTYKVRNSSGRTVGAVQPSHLITSASGKKLGYVSFMDGYWFVGFADPSRSYIDLTRLSSTVWGVSVQGSWTGPYMGRAKKGAGHWVLQKKVHGKWVGRGMVPGACKGQLAAGALRLLLWR